MSRARSVVLTICVLAAGCLEAGNTSQSDRALLGDRIVRGPGGGLFNPDWALDAVPFGEDHDHNNASDHAAVTTPNFEVVGHDVQRTDYYGRPSGGYGCSETKERDGRILSVVHSFDTDVAFLINDVTDPKHPTKIGELVMQSAQVYDIALTEDQRFVLLSTSPFEAGPDLARDAAPASAVPLSFRDACTGQIRPVVGPEAGLPYHAGVVLVDISNPRNPLVVDFVSTPPWGHSVRTSNVDGRQFVTVTVLSVTHASSYYAFLEILEGPAGAKLLPLSVYQLPDPAEHAEVTGTGHDGLIARHPITGQTLAYLAYGDAGLVLLDMSNPLLPSPVSVYKDWSMLDAGVEKLYVHGAVPNAELWDGRHYTILGEECSAHRVKAPTCLVVVLDTTDPTRPEFVSAWTIPVDFSWSAPLQFSIHYFAVQNRTLFVSTYHGGLWAVDLSTPEALRMMPTIGVFAPVLEAGGPSVGGTNIVVSVLFEALYPGLPWDNRPFVFDVNPLGDSNLVVYDYSSGLYVVRFDAANPAPPPPPWPLGFNAG